MTTKNNQPTKLSQILESPAADQWYPVWDEEKMWAKVNALSVTSSRKRKYALWILALGICWITVATERLKTQVTQTQKRVPIAQVESAISKRVAPIAIQILPPSFSKKTKLGLFPKGSIKQVQPDSLAGEKEFNAAKFLPLNEIRSRATPQKVFATTLTQIQLPPKPWRKKHSTLYTLRVPETPFDWNSNDGFVRRLERQIKSAIPPPNNGWVAFQLHWESGTAFTLVHRSRDTLSIQDTEIQLPTKNR